MDPRDEHAQGLFQGEVLFRLKALDERFERIERTFTAAEARSEREMEKYETRIRALETASTRMQAIAAVLAAAAGYLSSLIPKPWP